MTDQVAGEARPAVNEAAERLRSMWGMGPQRQDLLNTALATERRNTVERARRVIADLAPFVKVGSGSLGSDPAAQALRRAFTFLDEVAS